VAAVIAGALPGVASAVPAVAALVADPGALVNPLLGTSNSGNTFPGADAPFGMVQWSPDTTSRPYGGGYAYKDTAITGFSLTHMSGPGCAAMGDVPILPTTGTVAATDSVGFAHANESASPGGYAVTLSNNVRTELTATTRSGMARFTFPATTQANLLFKLGSGPTTTTNPTFTVVSSSEVSGSVTSGHFCGSTQTDTTYFDILFDQPFTANAAITGGDALTFDTSGDTVLQAKVGVSFVSVANARANRVAENPNWDFGAIQTATHAAWNALLGKVQISGGTAAQQAVFYTSLYHALLHPNVVSDANGQYLGFDRHLHTVSSGQTAQYANYSGWDIYRAQAQLEALLAPTQASDSAQSMVNDYTQGGLLPKWAYNDGETFVMVGDPAAPIIADYYAFGARDFDTATAEAALVAQGTDFNADRPGIDYLASKGYLPADGTYTCCNEYGAVSTLLEYNTADFAVSAFAGALGDTTAQSQFANRAQDWKNVFNSASGFMQPKLADGTWKTGFAATSGTDFVEGTSWQYTGMVPFNLRGLADAKGGDSAMVSYLNSVLAGFKGAGGAQANLGNEPSLELPWEYDYVGQPYKTQQVIRQVQDQLWPDAPASWGVGNDDLGTMSAWYVWSALGMFPETPGTSDLAIGSPMFTHATIALGNGGTITINAPAAADNAPYVQSLSLNGSAWNNAYLPASFALAGGTLDYTLGTTANTSWATATSSAPPSYQGDGGAAPLYPQAGPTGAITSGITGKCVDVDKSGTTNGTKVDIYGCNGTNAQKWTILGDGTVRAFGMCLDATSSGISNGTLVDLYTCNGTPAQRWTFDATTGALDNPESGKCLDDPGSSTTNGTQLQLYTCNTTAAQRWTPPTSVTGALVSGIASRCLDDAGASPNNGTKIETAACTGGAGQQWTLLGDGTVRIMHKCLDITGGATAKGTPVELWWCHGGTDQVWTYDASTGALTNPTSGLCLDVPGSSTADGVQLQIYTCNGTSAQNWTLPS
jgi:predicted alpha-1,2-mannosidase